MLAAEAILLLAVNGTVGFGSPWAGRRLAPAVATKVLTGAALATLATTGFVLAVVVFDFLAQIPWVGALGRWSTTSLLTHAPVSLGVGLGCCTVLLAVIGRLAHRVAEVMGEFTWSARACRDLPSAPSRMVVIDDSRPDAFALPGLRGGRVVVTQGMLAVLNERECSAMFAHERSHLRHRHHVYVGITDIVASANPLLRQSARTVRLSVERWADEDAAAAVGSRSVAASALARAGLATAGARSVRLRGASLAMADSHLAQRTRQLLVPPVRNRRLVVAAAVSVLIPSAVEERAMCLLEPQFG